jgi:ABC-type polysaccharide/polyol phosphate export permease
MSLATQLPPVPSRSSTRSQVALALADLRETLSLSWFWMALSWNDIVCRYRGSMLGPFWLTITTAAFIAGLGPLYGRLFSLDMATYVPFMALGVTTWQFITGTINDSCNAFIASGHLIRQMPLPRLALLMRVIWRNILAFLHNLPIYLVIFIAYGLPLDWHLLAILPGFILICLNLAWMGLIVAILCARFRDVAPIVSAFLQIGFFVTPVIWNHKLQRIDSWIVDINPFAALIELVRAPMMGAEISPALIRLNLICLIFGSVLAAALFVRCRRRIVFWV